ncbi:MAG: trehalose-phosphatase [Gemmatimonadota bacterium]|nr:trehalose-phosphatase [Gemmatimonadota bacterium]
MPSSATETRVTPPHLTPDAALFLDLDGTLLELADRPAAVAADDALRGRLVTLTHALGGAVAVVSGRAINDLDRILRPLVLPAAGQHGIEWRDATRHRRQHPTPTLPAETLAELDLFVAAHPGTLLESKGASFAVHFRGRPDAARAVATILADAARDAGPGWEVLQGKMMTELRPAGVHKGDGIRRLLADPPFAGRRPVFVGDDWTDEDGFVAVNALQGISVAVAVERETQARYRLDGVAAVHDWLDRSAAALSPTRERG